MNRKDLPALRGCLRHQTDIIAFAADVAEELRRVAAYMDYGELQQRMIASSEMLRWLSEYASKEMNEEANSPRCDSCGRDCAPCEAGTCERIS